VVKLDDSLNFYNIQQWLQKNHTEYDTTETIPKLSFHVAPNKSQEKLYKLDQIANEIVT
jgi:hypothetical protein